MGRREERNFLSGAGVGVAVGSPGYGRPCDHQRQVLAVLVVRELGGAPVPVHRQSGGHSLFFVQRRVPTVLTVQKTVVILLVLFFDSVEDAPLLYNDRCLGYDSAENCGISTVAAVISVVCWCKDASQDQDWIVRERGYVCVVFGALNVESQCSWAVVQNC